MKAQIWITCPVQCGPDVTGSSKIFIIPLFNGTSEYKPDNFVHYREVVVSSEINDILSIIWKIDLKVFPV